MKIVSTPPSHIKPLRGSPGSTSTLFGNHKYYHPHEAMLPIRWKLGKHGAELGCDFFGRWVKLQEMENLPLNWDWHQRGTVNYRPETDIAAVVLDRTFGRTEDIFIMDSAPLAAVLTNPDGYSRPIYWQVNWDCITVQTREGFTISMQGTNLVEAAVWLPRVYQYLQKHQATGKERIKFVAISLAQGSELATDKGGLKVKCRLPDYRKIQHHPLLDGIVQQRMEKALHPSRRVSTS